MFAHGRIRKPSLEVKPTTVVTLTSPPVTVTFWPITLNFKPGLDNVNMNQHVRYLGQRLFIMVTRWNRADHYIFILWLFLLLSSLFSSPNLSHRILDVCHTSTHGVALVRI